MVMRNQVWGRGLLALALLGCMAQTAWAEDKRADREREALRRAQQQAQQMQKEKAELQSKLAASEQEKTTWATERQKLSAQAGSAQQKLKALGLQNEQLQAALDATTAEKTSVAAQLQEWTQRATDLGNKLARSDRELQQALADKKQLQMVLAQRDKTLAAYLEKNRQLYQAGRTVIDQCKDQSAGSMLLRLEPFTGIQMVEVENRLEQQRDALDAHKIIPDEQ
jgi:chromosome segregation ATPase